MSVTRGIIPGLLLWSLSAGAQTPQILIQSETQHLSLDSSTTTRVVISGARALHAFSIRVAYDPLLVRCTAVRDKGFLGSMTMTFPGIDSLTGEAGFDAAILGPGGVNGDGDLLEMSFSGERSGVASLHFTRADLRDTADKPITVQTQDAEILVGDANGIARPGRETAGKLRAVPYPNPFNSSTTFVLDGLYERAAISIYSLLGQEVMRHEVHARDGEPVAYVWDGRDQSGRALASGVYLFRATSAGSSAWSRIILLK